MDRQAADDWFMGEVERRHSGAGESRERAGRRHGEGGARDRSGKDYLCQILNIHMVLPVQHVCI